MQYRCFVRWRGKEDPNIVLPDCLKNGCRLVHRSLESWWLPYNVRTGWLGKGSSGVYYQFPDVHGNLNSEDVQILLPDPVTIIRTGKPGRPRKAIDLDFLREASSTHHNLKLTELAKLLGIHRNVLRLYMKRHGILREYSAISDADLDDLVRTFKIQKPESGLRYIVSFLRNHGLRVQRSRVRSSLNRVDGLGRVLRNRRAIRRRTYQVKRPNAIWHVDGHHKLIRWGIVIHGFIDGFCRTVSDES
jgi:hypothetical protein